MTARTVKPNRRKRPRQTRSVATVDAILSAAAHVFEEHGFARASVNAVAARAGVSVGSLYQYFPSKEAVIVAMIERHTEATLAELESAFAQVGELPLEAAVRFVVASMVDAHRSGLNRLLARELDELGRLDGVQRAIDERAGRAVARFLSARQAELQVPDLEFASFLLVRSVDLLTHAAISDRPESLEDGRLVNELSRLVLGYLRFRRADGAPVR
jgi:AcrR family transcriptional regulator